MSAEVAVAVVSWNTRELLDACLTSLRADHDSGLAEVWVVDNASDDGSAAMVADRHPWVRLLALEENLGYGAAANLAIARSDAPFVAPANADLVFEPGALARLVQTARDHPRTGAVAPRLITLEGTVQHSVHPFPTVAVGLLLSSGLHRVTAIARRLPMEGSWDPERARDVDWAHGALLVVPRDAWNEVGGFDPDQWLYAEDLDLCWRLHQAGRPTRYEPAARVRHHVSAATAQSWSAPERAVRTQRAAYAWMAARQGIPRTRAVALSNLIGPGVRLVFTRAAARVAPRRYAARRDRAARYVAMHRTGLEPRESLEAFRRARPSRGG